MVAGEGGKIGKKGAKKNKGNVKKKCSLTSIEKFKFPLFSHRDPKRYSVNMCEIKWAVLLNSHGMCWVEIHWVGWD